MQEELRSPGEAAGTGHRGAGFPKRQQEPACPTGLFLLFSLLETVMEHLTSGSLLSSPLAFSALRALPAPPHPLCPGLFSTSYQSKPGGDTLPFCLTVPVPGSSVAASGSVLVCFLTVEEELHPSGNGRAQWQRAQGSCGVPVPTWAQCGTAGSKGCAGMRRVPRAGLLGDAQPKACHPAVPLPMASCHFPHGAKLPFDCALLLHFSSPSF